MQLVKKNIVSIICVLVGVAALVTLFIVSGWYDQFNTRLTQSKTSNDTVASLMRQPRVIPSPNPDGTAVPLEVFPNDKVFEAGDRAMNQVHNNAQTLLRTAVDMNRKGHEVLVNGALPRPNSMTEA